MSDRHGPVCEPIKQPDGHPDLYFRNGGENGPDARLIAAAPEMLAALERLDADWTKAFPDGPDGSLDYYGIGKMADETVSIWRDIRAAIAKARPSPESN